MKFADWARYLSEKAFHKVHEVHFDTTELLKSYIISLLS